MEQTNYHGVWTFVPGEMDFWVNVKLPTRPCPLPPGTTDPRLATGEAWVKLLFHVKQTAGTSQSSY